MRIVRGVTLVALLVLMVCARAAYEEDADRKCSADARGGGIGGGGGVSDCKIYCVGGGDRRWSD